MSFRINKKNSARLDNLVQCNQKPKKHNEINSISADVLGQLQSKHISSRKEDLELKKENRSFQDENKIINKNGLLSFRTKVAINHCIRLIVNTNPSLFNQETQYDRACEYLKQPMNLAATIDFFFLNANQEFEILKKIIFEAIDNRKHYRDFAFSLQIRKYFQIDKFSIDQQLVIHLLLKIYQKTVNECDKTSELNSKEFLLESFHLLPQEIAEEAHTPKYEKLLKQLIIYNQEHIFLPYLKHFDLNKNTKKELLGLIISRNDCNKTAVQELGYELLELVTYEQEKFYKNPKLLKELKSFEEVFDIEQYPFMSFMCYLELFNFDHNDLYEIALLIAEKTPILMPFCIRSFALTSDQEFEIVKLLIRNAISNKSLDNSFNDINEPFIKIGFHYFQRQNYQIDSFTIKQQIEIFELLKEYSKPIACYVRPVNSVGFLKKLPKNLIIDATIHFFGKTVPRTFDNKTEMLLPWEIFDDMQLTCDLLIVLLNKLNNLEIIFDDLQISEWSSIYHFHKFTKYVLYLFFLKMDFNIISKEQQIKLWEIIQSVNNNESVIKALNKIQEQSRRCSFSFDLQRFSPINLLLCKIEEIQVSSEEKFNFLMRFIERMRFLILMPNKNRINKIEYMVFISKIKKLNLSTDQRALIFNKLLKTCQKQPENQVILTYLFKDIHYFKITPIQLINLTTKNLGLKNLNLSKEQICLINSLKRSNNKKYYYHFMDLLKNLNCIDYCLEKRQRIFSYLISNNNEIADLTNKIYFFNISFELEIDIEKEFFKKKFECKSLDIIKKKAADKFIDFFNLFSELKCDNKEREKLIEKILERIINKFDNFISLYYFKKQLQKKNDESIECFYDKLVASIVDDTFNSDFRRRSPHLDKILKLTKNTSEIKEIISKWLELDKFDQTIELTPKTSTSISTKKSSIILLKDELMSQKVFDFLKTLIQPLYSYLRQEKNEDEITREILNAKQRNEEQLKLLEFQKLVLNGFKTKRPLTRKALRLLKFLNDKLKLNINSNLSLKELNLYFNANFIENLKQMLKNPSIKFQEVFPLIAMMKESDINDITNLLDKRQIKEKKQNALLNFQLSLISIFKKNQHLSQANISHLIKLCKKIPPAPDLIKRINLLKNILEKVQQSEFIINDKFISFLDSIISDEFIDSIKNLPFLKKLLIDIKSNQKLPIPEQKMNLIANLRKGKDEIKATIKAIHEGDSNIGASALNLQLAIFNYCTSNNQKYLDDALEITKYCIFPSLKTMLSQHSKQLQEKKRHVDGMKFQILSNDPENYLKLGTQTGGCQKIYGDYNLAYAVLGYIDSKNHIFAITRKNKIIARNIARLLLDNETNSIVLFIEPVYSLNETAVFNDLLLTKAKEISRHLNVPLAVSRNFKGLKKHSFALRKFLTFGNIYPYEYSDSIEGYAHGSIMKSCEYPLQGYLVEPF